MPASVFQPEPLDAEAVLEQLGPPRGALVDHELHASGVLQPTPEPAELLAELAVERSSVLAPPALEGEVQSAGDHPCEGAVSAAFRGRSQCRERLAVGVEVGEVHAVAAEGEDAVCQLVRGLAIHGEKLELRRV